MEDIVERRADETLQYRQNIERNKYSFYSLDFKDIYIDSISISISNIYISKASNHWTNTKELLDIHG